MARRAWRAHDALKKVMEKFSFEDIKDIELVPVISRLTVCQSISSEVNILDWKS